MLRTFAPVLGLALLFGSAAVTSSHAATGQQGFVAPPSVLAFDQKAKDKAISIDYVRLPQPGYVAVYRVDKNGKPTGEPIGYSRKDAGDHRQIQVKLSEAPKSGDKLWVSLYKDANGSESFEPGKGDKPFWSKDKLPAESRILMQ